MEQKEKRKKSEPKSDGLLYQKPVQNEKTEWQLPGPANSNRHYRFRCNWECKTLPKGLRPKTCRARGHRCPACSAGQHVRQRAPTCPHPHAGPLPGVDEAGTCFRNRTRKIDEPALRRCALTPLGPFVIQVVSFFDPESQGRTSRPSFGRVRLLISRDSLGKFKKRPPRSR